MYRWREGKIEVFLAHPGGPFHRRRDAGAWTIPKGEPLAGEELEKTAVREFREETGIEPPAGTMFALDSIRQKGGKSVWAWAFEGDWSPEDGLPSNTFELEWPPRSGKKHLFPEIDRAAFFPLDLAREKINAAQIPFLERLASAVEPPR